MDGRVKKGEKRVVTHSRERRDGEGDEKLVGGRGWRTSIEDEPRKEGRGSGTTKQKGDKERTWQRTRQGTRETMEETRKGRR